MVLVCFWKLEVVSSQLSFEHARREERLYTVCSAFLVTHWAIILRRHVSVFPAERERERGDSRTVTTTIRIGEGKPTHPCNILATTLQYLLLYVRMSSMRMLVHCFLLMLTMRCSHAAVDPSGTQVIAVVSISRHASSTHQVERLVESIRGVGEYNGIILVITDYPEDYIELQKAGPNIAIFEPGPDMIRCQKMSAMVAKRLKTSLIEIVFKKLNLLSVEVILYIDMDVVVGSPLLPFFEEVGQVLTTAGPNATVIAQKQRHADQPFHGGVFALNKQSDECLLLWRKFMDRSPINRDQKALGQALNTNSGCTFESFSKLYVTSPSAEFITRGDRNIFVHITNTYKANHLNKNDQLVYFTKVLNITKTPIFESKVSQEIKKSKHFSIPKLCIKNMVN